MRSMVWTGVVLVLGLGIAQANTLSISATTGFLADMVRNVGGSRVSVVQVVPDGSDPHSFEPRPSVVRAIAGSRVLFANGLFLEPFLEKLEAQLPAGARVVKLAEGMPNLIEVAENGPHQEAEHAHDHGAYDPHLWLDPTYGLRYVEKIRDALIALDPAGRAIYTQNAARYIQRIRQVDAEVQRCLAAIPQARRKLVSQHESLSYFNRYYRLESLGSIADFVGQERGPASLARLAQVMKREGVRVIFVEPQFSQSQARSLAEATGARIVRIYSDAFDRAVDSYLELIQANGQAICTAFK
ncbi:metal ABC transporter substrate-binding protein [Meiothermus ruber]|uniref:Periplasmic solute binding protein n=2 Tax=Meiothermus ruber (strain ATCC 35948 / DSM 1279 / VKM B-1258 / 21) TaxID=504728 RepID=A0A806CQ84_MEIRD|nr:metal ABC transporter substrate-binding protein [Meiothermus ruber]ADD28232.1 periplasmic solute binding protein [Meiothermus ruber DSM 1279]MCL6528945.1 metal ABC transporter substrate-binding protein [Meiothermus ruber]